jgi:predicted AlkP superfamily phosphohydrolase/phosphomutase
MNSAAAWSSIVTGYNPGQHGVYDFGYTPQQHDSVWRPTTARDRRKDPFWRLLSAAGQHVGIINVPISYPVDAVNGFMLAGMDTPSIHSPGFAHPANLLNELRRRGIHYYIDAPNLGTLSSRAPHRLPRLVQRLVEARSRTILHLMETRPWQVLMAVFIATDRVQHFFWPDTRAPIEAPEWLPIRCLFQQIDAFFGQALDRIDEHTTVMVVSDHGFGPARRAMYCLNSLFAQLGLLRYRQGADQLKHQPLKYALRFGRKMLPVALQDPLARAFPKLHFRAASESRFSGIEISQTQVFASPDGEGVFLNLRERESQAVDLSQEYRSLREQIRDILLNLTDCASGRHVIRAVHQREDLYQGPYLHKAPDLVIEWDYEAAQNSLCYSRGKESILAHPRTTRGSRQGWNASHRPQGIFVASGPQIKQGTTITNATIYDIAPTILYLQGHPFPRDMDGQVLTDMLTRTQLHDHPVGQAEPASGMAQETAADLNVKDARKLKKRFRGLGYLE